MLLVFALLLQLGVGALAAPLISFEYHNAYMFGNADGAFRPRANTTRAEVAAILVRTMVEGFEDGAYPEDATTLAAFSDVTPANWFYWYVIWAYAEGLVQGYEDGTFRPNDPISRQEYAAMAARTGASLHQAEDLAFADADTISNWARDYVYIAFRNGWMVGDDHNNFRPTANIIRAEVATATNRVLGRLDNNIGLPLVIQNLDDARDFPDVGRGAWYFGSVLVAANDHRSVFGENGEILRMYILVD